MYNDSLLNATPFSFRSIHLEYDCLRVCVLPSSEISVFTFNFVGFVSSITFFHHRRVLRWRCMVDTLALPFEQVWSVVERVLVAVVAFKTKVIFYSFQPILSNHFQIGECAEFFCIFLCHGEANTDSVSPCPAKETVHLLPIRVKKLPTCK